MNPYIFKYPENELKSILSACGVNSLDDFFSDIPIDLKLEPVQIPAFNEPYLKSFFNELASLNKTPRLNFAGFGAYNHYIPAAVNSIINLPEFYTAYTPYQAERSQGILQAIWEYQEFICRLTGFEVSQASLYDGGTAAYEAVNSALLNEKEKRVYIDGSVNPLYGEVIKHYSKYSQIKYNDFKKDEAVNIPENSAVVFQYPSFLGVIDTNLGKTLKTLKNKNCSLICVSHPILLSVLKPPFDLGFDYAVGEGQPLGLSLNYGGPYLGFFAARSGNIRKIPGRIAARTIDADGNKAYTLTLQAREQHIRRSKAVSNICSNQSLCALAACVYLALMGKTGLQNTAKKILSNTVYLKKQLSAAGFEVLNENEANILEVAVKIKNIKQKIKDALLKNIMPGIDLTEYGLKDVLLIAVPETVNKENINELVKVLK